MTSCGIDKEHFPHMQALDMQKLVTGTKLVVETENSTYKMEVLENGNILLSGGKTRHDTVRYIEPVEACVVGASYHGTLGLDRIDKDHSIILSIVGGRELKTSHVQEVTIIAPDESWTYCLDWKRQSS